MLQNPLEHGWSQHSPSPPPLSAPEEDRYDILHIKTLNHTTAKGLSASSHSALGSAGASHSLGHVCTNPAALFPLICAEVVEKLTNQIFPIQPMKLSRWSFISSEGRKPLNTLYMRVPPLCQLKRQNEDVLDTN